MKELKELSANYATEKTNEMMSQIVAQAFADGYRMGYKDREDEIQVDLCDSKTEFVDLGLPSGTKWATCNVGSDTPEGYGDYFTWGETSPKQTYTWVSRQTGRTAQEIRTVLPGVRRSVRRDVTV